jgi:release factor H-coupled RctB family protein
MDITIFASTNNWIEGTAVEQLRKTAELAGMRRAVGLPDLHPGKSSPIGAAFITEDLIYPTLVGNDVGCGIALWRTGLSSRKLKREAWADRLRHLDSAWDGDTGAWLLDSGVALSGFEGSLGTIGSGNHFAELQTVERIEKPEVCARLGVDTGSVYLCVHSGSRGFGESVLRAHIDTFGSAGLEGGTEDAHRYLRLHDQAAAWAVANRDLVARRVMDRLGTEGERIVDLCHNSVSPCRFAGSDCWLHRKGAAPSDQGPVVIPGSRGAFTWLMTPRDAGERSAFSLAHGAGRKWSRTDSRARLEKHYSVRDLERTELGSYVICEDKSLLYEEAPKAYKNIAIVIDDMVKERLADPVAVLRPLVTYKVRRGE